MLDYLGSTGYTNERQHKTMFTCWHCSINHGLLFDCLESATAYALTANQPIQVYYPIFYGE